MTANIFKDLDSYPADYVGEDLFCRIDEFCFELEELIAEFDLEAHLKDDRYSMKIRFLFADHYMTMWTTIIGIKRLKRRPGQERLVDDITLRAARKVINHIISHFHEQLKTRGDIQFAFIHFFTFIPFCAIFTLYEHIMACSNVEECENDLRSLEEIGAAMKQASEMRSDFVPFFNTVNALNKVSRAIIDAVCGRNKDPSPSSGIQARSPQPSRFSESGINMTPSHMDTSQNIPSSMQGLYGSDLSIFQGFPLPVNFDGEFQPHGFVRAVENDLITRNWNEWWDVDGDMTVDMSAGLAIIPERQTPLSYGDITL